MSVLIQEVGRCAAVCCLSVVLLCCSQGREGEAVFGATRSAIAGGVLQPGRPEVVVVKRGSQGFCSGFVVHPRVVVTAKHCVQASGATQPARPEDMSVLVGPNVSNPTEQVGAVTVRTTPGAYSVASGPVTGELIGVDVAVVTLDDPLDDVRPFTVRRDSPAALLNGLATMVGYGETSEAARGEKYEITLPVDEVTDEVIRLGPSACLGDSGGPLIDTSSGEVFGVVSYNSGVCGDGDVGVNRIDIFMNMVDMALAEVCDAEPEVCDGEDNDCDTAVDEACVPLGGECATDRNCASDVCFEHEGQRRCAEACDRARPGDDCGEGFMCVPSGCEGRCVPRSGDAGLPFGETCAADGDCQSTFCARDGEGDGVCSELCVPGGVTCSQEQDCRLSDPKDTCGYCASTTTPMVANPTDGTACASSGPGIGGLWWLLCCVAGLLPWAARRRSK